MGGRANEVPSSFWQMALCSAAFGTILGCAGEPYYGPPFAIDMPIDRFTLDNGLEVVLVPNHTAPSVTALIAIRAGSAVEEPSQNGYSHLFEHMIFQGSVAVPDSREFHDRLDNLGISSNGTTSVDRVTYFFTAERDAFEAGLELFAGAVIAPALDPVVLEKEKGVVLGEFDINESDADFEQYRSTRAELYGDYATRLDPLGSREAVSAASVEQMRAMHATYYVPNNALLVLSGDLTRDAAEELSLAYFGAWERGADPTLLEVPSVPPLASNHYRVLARDVSNTEIDIWWQGPSLDDDPDADLAGDLLSAVTFQVDHQFRGLVGADSAHGAGLSLRTTRRTSYINLHLTVIPGNESAVFYNLGTVLNTLGAPGDVTNEQLEIAKSLYFRSYLFNIDSPTSLPHSIADEWALTDSERYFSLVDQMYSINLGDLAHLTSTYMRQKPRAVVLMTNPETIAAQGIDTRWLEGKQR